VTAKLTRIPTAWIRIILSPRILARIGVKSLVRIRIKTQCGSTTRLSNVPVPVPLDNGRTFDGNTRVAAVLPTYVNSIPTYANSLPVSLLEGVPVYTETVS